MTAKAQPKRAARLKVFRTAIGFHDAYVAAPSRKAALAAWGTDKDLFARGAAEEVVEPALTAEPLSQPGTVVRRLRSVPADGAAAPRQAKRAARQPESGVIATRPRPAPPPPLPPRPDNGHLEQARRALAEARRRRADAERNLAAQERELASARRELEQRQGKELRLLTRQLEQAEEDYAARVARWRDQTGARK